MSPVASLAVAEYPASVCESEPLHLRFPTDQLTVFPEHLDTVEQVELAVCTQSYPSTEFPVQRNTALPVGFSSSSLSVVESLSVVDLVSPSEPLSKLP